MRCSSLSQNKIHGFLALGGVVLAITGAEALYADMGHFGRKPMQIAWLYFVLPALLFNYFGQGALLLHDRLGDSASVLPHGSVLGALSVGRFLQRLPR